MTITIQRALGMVSGLGLCLVAAMGVTAYIGSKNVNTGMQEMAVISGALRTHMESDMMHDALRADVLAGLCAESDADKQSALADVTDHAKKFRKLVAELVSMDLPNQLKDAIGEVRPKLDAYIASAESQVLLGTRDREAARAKTGDFRLAFQDLEGKLESVSELIEEQVKVAAEHQESAVQRFRLMMLSLAGITCVAMGAAAMVLSRSTIRRLRERIGVLTTFADSATNSTDKVSESSKEVAHGASEQAAALEESSSALEEMSSMTRKNAETAQQAAQLSAGAQGAAVKGNEAMTRMSAAINEIQKSAGETAKIIKVIDEIAFQTNLLALNAAVEAARAGEAGKGFAVVAEEVRSLAIRSADAAKNTTAMIEGSVKTSKNGVALAGQVDAILKEITSASTKVNALVAEIASASIEQSKGIDEMSKAIGQVDKVTQANAASADQTANVAGALKTQSGQLRIIVGELLRICGGALTSDERR